MVIERNGRITFPKTSNRPCCPRLNVVKYYFNEQKRIYHGGLLGKCCIWHWVRECRNT